MSSKYEVVDYFLPSRTPYSPHPSDGKNRCDSISKMNRMFLESSVWLSYSCKCRKSIFSLCFHRQPPFHLSSQLSYLSSDVFLLIQFLSKYDWFREWSINPKLYLYQIFVRLLGSQYIMVEKEHIFHNENLMCTRNPGRSWKQPITKKLWSIYTDISPSQVYEHEEIRNEEPTQLRWIVRTLSYFE